MLVIFQDEQIFRADKICQGCLLASQKGVPRWKGGKLQCGHCVGKLNQNQPTFYECEMGFRLANIE